MILFWILPMLILWVILILYFVYRNNPKSMFYKTMINGYEMTVGHLLIYIFVSLVPIGNIILVIAMLVALIDESKILDKKI